MANGAVGAARVANQSFATDYDFCLPADAAAVAATVAAAAADVAAVLALLLLLLLLRRRLQLSA